MSKKTKEIVESQSSVITTKKMNTTYFVERETYKEDVSTGKFGLIGKIFELENGGKEVSIIHPHTERLEFELDKVSPDVIHGVGEILIEIAKLAQK